MSVYIDKVNLKFGRMVMCHMIADTPEELHEMADKIRISRRHFQPKSFPHYDVCKAYKEDAIKKGAIEISNMELARKIKELRESYRYR